MLCAVPSVQSKPMPTKPNQTQFAQILVKAPDSQYPIIIGDGVLKSLPALFADRKLKGKVAIVTNETLAPLYGKPLSDALGNATLITVPDGEQYKTLETVRTLYDAFIGAGLDRRSVIVGLGGGVVGDMAGFAAPTYLRGGGFVRSPPPLRAVGGCGVGGQGRLALPQGQNPPWAGL